MNNILYTYVPELNIPVFETSKILHLEKSPIPNFKPLTVNKVKNKYPAGLYIKLSENCGKPEHLYLKVLSEQGCVHYFRSYPPKNVTDEMLYKILKAKHDVKDWFYHMIIYHNELYEAEYSSWFWCDNCCKIILNKLIKSKR